ncbi:hypothetical protein GCM10009836_11730 [Pseudonocardia ailaonensis]|uniref:Transcriptional regulator n=1 Tax=Pseudonocardia ailaonensis TaxID=367279 RepID=A0ABN2MRC5_9PSEU
MTAECAPLRFRVLGEVEAWDGRGRVELGGPKQRALLVSLLVRAGRTVSLEQLVDDLWPDEPPPRAAATVQVFVSNLRRALEPGRTRGTPARVLVTAGRGYRLAVDPLTVDAHAFADLAGRGRRALAADDHREASDLLDRAAELWAGPALAGVPASPFVQAEAARLEELRLTAAEDRAEAELGLGRHLALVPDLERHVQRHPLRERSRGHLMLALYRCGRQADALGAYRAGRAVLGEELGLEPSPRLRALEAAVLRQDPRLDGSAAPRPAPRPDAPGRVLVVDDSGLNRRLLATAVAAQGHEVHTAENGTQALDLLRADEFDVVLLDLMMPVLDGYSTLAAIKADPGLEHLPVIIVSAVGDTASVVRCIELGATDHLPKPFGAEMLRARLRTSLALKRSRAAERAEIAQLRRQVDHARAAVR